MSYDISVGVAGSNSDESDDKPFSMPMGEDLARLERLVGRVRALDPSAQIEETRKREVLCGFVVVESRKLPYMEVGSRAGFISLSMSSEPADLYRALKLASDAFDGSGYDLFDHQLGAVIHPAASFDDFMQQFRSQ